MTTLHDRLAALADDVPVRAADRDLWERGQRLHRKRRAGSVAIAAATCLLLGALGTLAWQQEPAPVQPASDTESLAIPDVFHEPGKWLPGTEGEPWDPLVALIPADRGTWFGAEPGWVGVSAATGEYRFLDLADADRDPTALPDGEDVALSPDGRYVAHWFSGPMPEAPGAADRSDPVVGYAVYDVTRGETVVRETRESEEGLMPSGLAWADSRHLVAGYHRLRWQGERVGYGGTAPEVRMHDVAADRATDWPGEVVHAADNGWTITWATPARARALDAPQRIVRLRGGSAVPPVASPSGTKFAGIPEVETSTGTVRGLPNRIGTAEPGPRHQAAFEPIPGRTRYLDLLGWRDENSVVATRVEPSSATDETTRAVVAVDVVTGEETALSTHQQATTMATGLLDLPVVDRPAPHRPWNPWVELATVAGVVLVGGLGLATWRRRVGP